MNVWLTRLRARCACGCSFETFALPPEEAAGGRAVARTRSGFAALLVEDRELLTLLQRILAEARYPVPSPAALQRLTALVADPAPDGQSYDTGLGPVCPRCEADAAEWKVDRQLPEVVLALPLLTHARWLRLPASERRSAVLAAAQLIVGPVRRPQSPVRG